MYVCLGSSIRCSSCCRPELGMGLAQFYHELFLRVHRATDMVAMTIHYVLRVVPLIKKKNLWWCSHFTVVPCGHNSGRPFSYWIFLAFWGLSSKQRLNPQQIYFVFGSKYRYNASKYSVLTNILRFQSVA